MNEKLRGGNVESKKGERERIQRHTSYMKKKRFVRETMRKSKEKRRE